MGTGDSPSQEKKGSRDWFGGGFSTLSSWVLEMEMGVAWALSGLSLISFIFTSIWYIDPALLTMVLQFQPATCTTTYSSFLIGISNCTWTSCRHGCTSEIFKCWHVLVNYTLMSGSRPIPPPWASLSSLSLPPPPSQPMSPSKLYPNVKGCGYPPDLQCEDFYNEYGIVDSSYPCWVSHMDPKIALTALDLRKLKLEVMYSLLPLATFILSTLYALCRLGVFSICNPLRCCPRPQDRSDHARLTPKQLFRYKKALMVRRAEELRGEAAVDPDLQIPQTIPEDVEGKEDDLEQSVWEPELDVGHDNAGRTQEVDDPLIALEEDGEAIDCASDSNQLNVVYQVPGEGEQGGQDLNQLEPTSNQPDNSPSTEQRFQPT